MSFSNKFLFTILKCINKNQTISLSFAHQFSTATLEYFSLKEKHSFEPKIKENVELIAEQINQTLELTKVIPIEASLKYLKSNAYRETYGQSLVWHQYRRNHKGVFASRKTRKTCIRQEKVSCGNPCPICRDEYLVLSHRNVELLKQFISPQTGRVLSYSKTGLCQKRHFELLVAVERAMEYGFLTFDVPFRKYDYSDYFSHIKNETKNN